MDLKKEIKPIIDMLKTEAHYANYCRNDRLSENLSKAVKVLCHIGEDMEDTSTKHLSVKEKFILFREDIESPEGVKTVQMSYDLLKVCGDALKEKGLLREDSNWFFSNFQDTIKCPIQETNEKDS